MERPFAQGHGLFNHVLPLSEWGWALAQGGLNRCAAAHKDAGMTRVAAAARYGGFITSVAGIQRGLSPVQEPRDL